MFRLDGQTAIVTGSATGIGEAIATLRPVIQSPAPPSRIRARLSKLLATAGRPDEALAVVAEPAAA